MCRWPGATSACRRVRRVLASAVGFVTTAFLGIPLAFAPGDAPAVPPAGAGIPAIALVAYQRAAATCPGLRWELLAGVGQVESAHGTGGGSAIGPDGVVSPPILGPPLDGTGAGGNTTPVPVGDVAGPLGTGRTMAPGRRSDAVPPRNIRHLGSRRRQQRRDRPARHRRRRRHRGRLPVRPERRDHRRARRPTALQRLQRLRRRGARLGGSVRGDATTRRWQRGRRRVARPSEREDLRRRARRPRSWTHRRSSRSRASGPRRASTACRSRRWSPGTPAVP